MKRLTPFGRRYIAFALAIVAALMMLVACDFRDGSAQPSCYELDVDAPKRPKLKAPTGPKVTRPALRVPSTTKRR